MHHGWISIYRKTQCHWLWEDKPFSKGQAWIDLLLSANHTAKKVNLGNELIEVPEGGLITSIAKLCKAWGWSNTKVTKFLTLLESDGMITKKSDAKKTVITIENYSKYSNSEMRKTMQKRRTNDAETMQKHTNNNVNNVNNENNVCVAETLTHLKDLMQNYSFSYELRQAVSNWVLYKIDRNEEPGKKMLESILQQIHEHSIRVGDGPVAELITTCIGSGYKSIVFDRLKKLPLTPEAIELGLNPL